MVYPRRDGSRSLAKFVALCAVTSCLLHGGAVAKVHKKQAPAIASTTCQSVVSEGDAAVGILIVTDSSCAKGGVGCIDDICRFCKTKDSPQSAEFIDCGKVGWTPAPAAATSAPAPAGDATVPSTGDATTCKADPGDIAAGVNVFYDASCAQGGLGCFNDHCRHCKFKETAESAHLNGCDVYGIPGSPATAPAAASPVSTPSPAPVSPVSPATPSSPALVPSADTGCAFKVSPGDFGVGIQLVGDATCARGGVGCFQDVCRFCKFRETTQASHYLACGDLGYNFDAAGFNTVDIDDTDAPPAAGTPPVTTAAPPATAAPPVTVAPPATAAPPATGTGEIDTGCAYAVSEGDAGVGIQLVGDATCVNGGVGCFADVCRFCKVRSTPHSSHLTACKDLGFDFTGGAASAPEPATTPAPVPTTPTEPVPATTTAPPAADPATGCPYPVTDGDFAVGVQLVGDPTCAHGGLGCFKDVCRYCKFHETPQSTHWLSCADFGYPRTQAPTFAPVDVVEPTEEPTVEPTVEPPVEPTVDPLTGCAYSATEGNLKVGIELVGDATCANGGLGCFKDVCRYCQFRKTAQSGHFMSCSDLGYDFDAGSDATEPVTDAPVVPGVGSETQCPYPVSEGDFAVGIQLVGDATCAGGGLGCFKNVCRFCKLTDTPQSKHFMRCADLGYPSVVVPPGNSATDAPVLAPADPETDAPTFAPVDPTTDAPVDVETDAPVDADTDASGDAEPDAPVDAETVAPVDAETDASGDADTESPTFAPVDVIDPLPTAPTDDDGSNDAAPTENPDIYDGSNDDDASEPAPPASDFTAAPPASDFTESPVGAPPSTEAPLPPAPGLPNYGTGCPYPVAEGDLAVGIELVGDASCVNGGLGCFKDMCRYCQVRKTPQSGHLMTCKGLGYHLGVDTDGSASEPATTVPSVPTADPATGCPYPVTDGDFAVGVQLVGDPTCAHGGLGCFKDVCRYCKFHETPQSTHWLSCADFGYPRTQAPTFAPVDIVEPTVDPSTGCAYAATEGNVKVGIELVGDATCANGGLGCFKDVCRYCQFRKTAQSGHFMSCSDLGYDFDAGSDVTEPATNAPATVTPGATCSLSVTEGDSAVGIQLVTDAACAKGGLGCVADVCRFCKFRDTPQSSHLLDCASFSHASPAPSGGIPIGQPTDVTDGKCPFTASEGDLNIGVQIIEDTTCDIDGLGCFHDACRFCKFFDTDKSAHLEDCSKFGFNFEPIATTAAPRPGVTTAPPPATVAPAVVPSGECGQTVSEGDKKAGINMVTDISCLNGGVGCLPDSVCRHCKVVETAANGHMEWCWKITGGASDTPVADNTAAPDSDATAPPATATPDAGSAAQCDQTVSEGNKMVGIDMFTDATCANGGVGCLPESTCRYCKRAESAASAHYIWCPDVVDHSAQVPVVVVTPAPAPAGPAPDASALCDQVVAPGDADQGIALATDPLCVNGGIGCLDKTTCRYCKRWATAASAHFEWCAGYDGYVPPAAAPVVSETPATTDTPAPTLDAAACSTEVAEGDAEVGVAAVHDESCLAGGVGCFGGVCRFCQVFSSEKSAHFLPCASMVVTIAPLRFAAKVQTKATSTKDEFDELFKDATFKWSIVGAACVGAIAVVALFGLGAKRALTRKSSHESSTDVATTDVETETDAATVPAVTSTESEETAAEEVHV